MFPIYVNFSTPEGPNSQSGRPDSNRRRPAWEAGILPLNYARGATTRQRRSASKPPPNLAAYCSRRYSTSPAFQPAQPSLAVRLARLQRRPVNQGYEGGPLRSSVNVLL